MNVTQFLAEHFARLTPFQATLWCIYLLAAVMLPVYHLRPILKYMHGCSDIGDACIRTEVLQCAWRVPALLFSMFVTPSLPLFLSIAFDMVGRIARILAMHWSQRRWQVARATASRGAVGQVASSTDIVRSVVTEPTSELRATIERRPWPVSARRKCVSEKAAGHRALEARELPTG
jgi:hypothetical protein